jgi:hypothetical protein
MMFNLNIQRGIRADPVAFIRSNGMKTDVLLVELKTSWH